VPEAIHTKSVRGRTSVHWAGSKRANPVGSSGWVPSPIIQPDGLGGIENAPDPLLGWNPFLRPRVDG
jgi:hypothetical protein